MISLHPPAVVKGRIPLPVSKSLANRLLILKALSGENLSPATGAEPEDVQLLREGLRTAQHSTSAEIYCGHAGTAMRFLTAYLSQKQGEWHLRGSARMHQRPIGILVETLKELGADISYLQTNGYPPLLIKGKNLKAKEISVASGFSSQYISALLLIAPFLDGDLSVTLSGQTVSEPYIMMTVEILRAAGCTIEKNDQHLLVKKTPLLRSAELMLEADWTAASYYYALCALSPQSTITLKGLHQKSLQGDALLPHIYESLGVTSDFNEEGLVLRHSAKAVSTFSFDFLPCPDLAQTVIVTCAGLGIGGRFTGLQTLRIKETDRLLAMQTELQKCGVAVTTGDDFLELEAGERQKGIPPVIETYSDHRMAMAFAAFSVVLPGLMIAHPEVVVKSYPAFWEHLISLGFNVNLQPH
jgi:3-phosphoshikimate 1-carboxyvinyltransferase